MIEEVKPWESVEGVLSQRMEKVFGCFECLRKEKRSRSKLG